MVESYFKLINKFINFNKKILNIHLEIGCFLICISTVLQLCNMFLSLLTYINFSWSFFIINILIYYLIGSTMIGYNKRYGDKNEI